MKKTMIALALVACFFTAAMPKANAAIMIVSIAFIQPNDPAGKYDNITMASMMPPFILAIYGGLTGRLNLAGLGFVVFLSDDTKVETALEQRIQEVLPFIDNYAIVKEMSSELVASAITATDGTGSMLVSLSEESIANYAERVGANDEQTKLMHKLLSSEAI